MNFAPFAVCTLVVCLARFAGACPNQNGLFGCLAAASCGCDVCCSGFRLAESSCACQIVSSQKPINVVVPPSPLPPSSPSPPLPPLPPSPPPPSPPPPSPPSPPPPSPPCPPPPSPPFPPPPSPPFPPPPSPPSPPPPSPPSPPPPSPPSPPPPSPPPPSPPPPSPPFPPPPSLPSPPPLSLSPSNSQGRPELPTAIARVPPPKSPESLVRASDVAQSALRPPQPSKNGTWPGCALGTVPRGEMPRCDSFIIKCDPFIIKRG